MVLTALLLPALGRILEALNLLQRVRQQLYFLFQLKVVINQCADYLLVGFIRIKE